ncbi:HigA family addiction module antitoxin [Thiolapillus sp.]|uniref:HigA family addiction module antitoxin n=1 Tax=Thiolapillus sp. TaxID=2017437 RepID=UPI003AF7FF13
MTEEIKKKLEERLVVLHPGELLRYHFMDPWDMDIPSLAAYLRCTRDSAVRLVRGERDITSEDARHLAVIFGTSEEFWLNLQRDYDQRMKSGGDT